MAAIGAVAGLIGQLLAQRKLKGVARAYSGGPMARRAFKGRKVPMPYAGKRSYPKNKGKVRNDGEGNKAMAVKYGKRVAPLKQNLEQKIRASLTPIDTLVRQSVGLDQYDADLTTHFATGYYRVFEVANVDDVRKVITKSLEGDANKDIQTYIKDYSAQIKLVNQQNTVVNIRVYEYIARNDLPKGTYVSTQDLASAGFLEETPHEVLNTTIGGTLFQNSAFCTFNKITKVRNVTLAPGKELVLTINHNKGNKINATLYESDNETRRSYTRGIVLQYIGSPCNGPPQGEDQSAMNLPGVSQWKVVWSFFKRFHFMNMNPHKGATYLEDTIPLMVEGVPQTGVPKWGSGAKGHVMNQESGLPELITRA